MARLTNAYLNIPFGEIQNLKACLESNLDKLEQRNFKYLRDFGFNTETSKTIIETINQFLKKPSDEITSESLKQELITISDTESSVSGSHQRAMMRFATFLRDQERFQKACENFNQIESRDIQIGSDSFHIANASFMGESHRFSNNSDASTGVNYDPGSKLVAAIADGVSGYSAEQKYNTGRLAANVAIKFISRYLKKHNGSLDEQGIKNITQGISKQIARRLKYLINQGIIYKHDISDASATFAAVIDHGNEFILVAMGDPLIFAFNSEGVIFDSVNQAHKGKQGTRSVSSGLGAIVERTSEETNTLGELRDKSNQEISDSKSENKLREYLRQNPSEDLDIDYSSRIKPYTDPSSLISIKVIDKSQIKGLVLCSDGICDNDVHEVGENRQIDKFNEQVIKKSFPDSRHAGILAQNALAFANASGNKDDKTVTVLIKQLT